MTADKLSPFVPKLRFPEFAQGPGWDHATVADLVKTVTPPKKLTTSTYLADGRFPIIDQSQSYICGWTNDDEAVITRPLPVIVFGDHTCVLKFVNRPFAQGADGVKILTASTRVSTLYLYHQLTYRPVVMEEYKRHFSVLKDKVVCFPDPKSGEQQKIADCLGSLDDLVAAEGRKLETLRQHKEGLMQQLFPQPGETVPRLRFPEFRDDQSWSAPQFADLYGFKRTNTLSRDKLNYETGTIRNIHYGDIHTKFKPLFRVADEYVPYVNADASANGFDDDAFCEEGDIVLADASEDLDDVGKAIEVVSLDGERVVAGTHTILATRRGSVPVVGFGGHLFQSAAVRSGIKKEAQGAKVYGISAKRISAVPVPIPPTLAEQQKIAECLGSLDDLIAAEGWKLETLRQHKQGLMQQLFPSLDGNEQ